MDTIVSSHRDNKTDESESGEREQEDIKQIEDNHVTGESTHDKEEKDDEESRLPEEKRNKRLSFFRLTKDKDNTIDKEV